MNSKHAIRAGSTFWNPKMGGARTWRTEIWKQFEPWGKESGAVTSKKLFFHLKSRVPPSSLKPGWAIYQVSSLQFKVNVKFNGHPKVLRRVDFLRTINQPMTVLSTPSFRVSWKTSLYNDSVRSPYRKSAQVWDVLPSFPTSSQHLGKLDPNTLLTWERKWKWQLYNFEE